MYKYYSLRRPLMPGCIPASVEIVSIVNYDNRMRVENGRYEAWGEFECSGKISVREMDQYELAPSRTNPDIMAVLDNMLEVIGTYEDRYDVPDRFTWFNPDIGYMWDQWVPYRKLEERYQLISSMQ